MRTGLTDRDRSCRVESVRTRDPGPRATVVEAQNCSRQLGARHRTLAASRQTRRRACCQIVMGGLRGPAHYHRPMPRGRRVKAHAVKEVAETPKAIRRSNPGMVTGDGA